MPSWGHRATFQGIPGCPQVVFSVESHTELSWLLRLLRPRVNTYRPWVPSMFRRLGVGARGCWPFSGLQPGLHLPCLLQSGPAGSLPHVPRAAAGPWTPAGQGDVVILVFLPGASCNPTPVSPFRLQVSNLCDLTDFETFPDVRHGQGLRACALAGVVLEMYCHAHMHVCVPYTPTHSAWVVGRGE